MIPIFSKLGLPALLVSGGFIGGLVFNARVLQKPCNVTCPPVPACVCNPPAVSVQPFDVDKIKNLRNFSYAPQFSGTITVSGVDSVFVKRAINEAVEEGFKKIATATDNKPRRR